MKKFSEIAKAFAGFEENSKKLLEVHVKKASTIISRAEESLEELEEYAETIKKETEEKITAYKNDVINQIKTDYEEKRVIESKKIVNAADRNMEETVKKIVEKFIGEL